MAVFPDEVFDDMLERCDTVNVLTRATEELDGHPVTLGAILRCLDDGFMAVELGQSPDGTGFVSVRRFDRFGEQMNVAVVEVDGSVMISA
jgi:formylmethanofuran dehydrogenase subunit C